MSYGLKVMDFNLFFNLLYADLRTPFPTIWSRRTTEDSHSRIAKFLSRVWNYEGAIRLGELNILPLRNGQWVNANLGTVFLPTTGDIPVPPGVDMPVLHPAAVANEERKKLFIQLGAIEPSIGNVRAAILKVYGSTAWLVNLENSKAHLRYLYLTHQSKYSRRELKDICIFGSSSQTGKPHREDFYVPSDQPYGPKDILEPTDTAPGMEVCLVHQAYFEDVPTSPSSSHLSWKRWLKDFVAVRERLRLVARDGNGLSDIWTYVAKHRPEKLLGFLEHAWKQEREYFTDNEVLKDTIKQIDASNLCIKQLSAMCPLNLTFLPLPNLQQQSLRFMKKSEPFPFLAIEGASSLEELSSKWMFLHTVFSVEKDDDINFLLQILSWIRIANVDADELEQQERLRDLYIAIDAKLVGSENRQKSTKDIRSVN